MLIIRGLLLVCYKEIISALGGDKCPYLVECLDIS